MTLTKTVEYRRILGYIYRAHISRVEGNPSLEKLRPPHAVHCQYSVSLLPNPPTSLHPARILAWTMTMELEHLHEGAIEQTEFVSFLGSTLKGAKEELCYLLSSRARRVGEGFIPLVDERATSVYGRAPDSDDTVGMCRVTGGVVDVDSFEMMPTFRVISRLGLLSLPKILHELLIKRLSGQ